MMLNRGFQSACRQPAHAHGHALPRLLRVFLQWRLNRELAAQRRRRAELLTGRAPTTPAGAVKGGQGQGQGLLLAYYQPDAMRDSAAEALLAVPDGVAVEWHARGEEKCVVTSLRPCLGMLPMPFSLCLLVQSAVRHRARLGRQYTIRGRAATVGITRLQLPGLCVSRRLLQAYAGCPQKGRLTITCSPNTGCHVCI
jgi:hypothetical protein